MNENLTELVMILDRSGSMHSLEQDTIGGFNSMIEKQKKEAGECLVSTVLFDDEQVVLHDRIPIGKVEKMTDRQYQTRGCTALVDALGGSIKHISTIHRYARKEDVPGKTIFVIITDGMENSSKKFTGEAVKKMIKDRERKYGWEFLFIGANIDAIKTAGQYGICADRAVNYHADGLGTEIVYHAVGQAVGCMRSNKSIDADWAAPIEKDFKSRKKK